MQDAARRQVKCWSAVDAGGIEKQHHHAESVHKYKGTAVTTKKCMDEPTRNVRKAVKA